MITLKDSTLTIDTPIESADTILTLKSDIDCSICGTFINNGVSKIVQFTKQGDVYKGRLLLTTEDIAVINNPLFYLTLIESNLSMTTNKVDIKLDINKIKLNIKRKTSKELQDITIRLASFEKLIGDLIKNQPILSSIDIKNKDAIKPGMVPITIDDKGHCIFEYPFKDIITEINGQSTVNNVIILSGKDIPVGSTNVEAALIAQSNAIKELNGYLNTLSSHIKTLTIKVGQIEKSLIEHTESSLI